MNAQTTSLRAYVVISSASTQALFACHRFPSVKSKLAVLLVFRLAKEHRSLTAKIVVETERDKEREAERYKSLCVAVSGSERALGLEKHT